MAQSPRFRQVAEELERVVLQETFRREGTSTRVEDHRISLITDEQVLVLNPHVEGQCGFVGVHPVANTDSPAIARTFYSGANHYPISDPVTMARLVYAYLRDWAYNPADAKTKEQVTAAVAPDFHSNVSHVVEALVKLEFLLSPASGVFCFNKRMQTPSFLQQPSGDGEIDLGPSAKETRKRLYGSIDSPPSRFSAKSFRIHFDLGFA